VVTSIQFQKIENVFFFLQKTVFWANLETKIVKSPKETPTTTGGLISTKIPLSIRKQKKEKVFKDSFS